MISHRCLARVCPESVQKLYEQPEHNRRRFREGKYMLINTWRAPTGGREGGAEPTHPAAAQPLRYSRAFGP